MLTTLLIGEKNIINTSLLIILMNFIDLYTHHSLENLIHYQILAAFIILKGKSMMCLCCSNYSFHLHYPPILYIRLVYFMLLEGPFIRKIHFHSQLHLVAVYIIIELVLITVSCG